MSRLGYGALTAGSGLQRCGDRTRLPRALRSCSLAITVVVLSLSFCGCRSSRWVTVRPKQQAPILERWNVISPGPIEPSARTMQMLRRHDLASRVTEPPQVILADISKVAAREPTAGNVYALAEVAYLNAKRSERDDKEDALSLYSTAISHAYVYLFDGRFRGMNNPYDPQFRGACDVYNGALEGILRLLQQRGGLTERTEHQIASGPTGLDLKVVSASRSWRLADFRRLEFASDYQVVGLRNHYRQFGLGVPLVAVRRKQANVSEQEQYYPQNLTFPVTAFLRLLPHDAEGGRRRAVIEFHDPLEKSAIDVAQTRVPMESDLSTPLAYFLNDPSLEDMRVSTRNLLAPIAPDALDGLFMLEPYRPGKIPVLMVHGFWATPVSWMEMFNDLRSMPQIRDKYQFWFYTYPTGQPFWHSAAKLRHDLAEVQRKLDPQGHDAALQQMVLVGHSMGGLLSRMQTMESGEEFWGLVSRKPLNSLRASQEVRTQLASTFYFRPSPSVRRVVTIATPHQGTEIANSTTRWLGQKLITLPDLLVGAKQRLKRENPDAFGPNSLLECQTSIDSLTPDSPVLKAMWTAKRAPYVRYHNIVAESSGNLSWQEAEGDGVVTFASARTWDAESESIVPSDHSTVHKHPRAILEVRRILLEHLAEQQKPVLRLPAGEQTAGGHRDARPR